MSELAVLYLVAAVAGVGGGVAAGWWRTPGLLALAFCLVPIAGLGATFVFC